MWDFYTLLENQNFGALITHPSYRFWISRNLGNPHICYRCLYNFFSLNITGLPPDITVDEFIQLMSKFGIIMRDPQTEEFKVKLYKDNQGNLKGDGLCCYLKVSYVVM